MNLRCGYLNLEIIEHHLEMINGIRRVSVTLNMRFVKYLLQLVVSIQRQDVVLSTLGWVIDEFDRLVHLLL